MRPLAVLVAIFVSLPGNTKELFAKVKIDLIENDDDHLT